MENRISVIIPTYNREAYICDAIDSVLNQDFGRYNYEIIVIDDGSTDNTEKVLKVYKDKITYTKIPHSGKPAVARNRGIAISSGEYIAFQDSDDMWPKNKIISQMVAFDNPKIIMSYGQVYKMKASGEITEEPLVKSKVLNYGESFNKLLHTNSISTLTVIAKKDAIISVGGFNESDSLRAIEDYGLWLKIASSYPDGIKLLNEPLAYYRQHSENISATDGLTALKRILSAQNSLWDFKGLNDSQRKDLEKSLYTLNQNISRLTVELNKQPLISVIMGVYNGEEFLDSSVNSILDQTIKDIEFIIVNDGSGKPTIEAINRHKDCRIRVIHQTNKGLANSLNIATSIATGKYIARQDVDDISLPSRLEKELQLLISDQKLGVVGSYFTYIDEKTLEPGLTITQPFKSIDVKRSMLIHNPLGHGTTMFKKEIFDKVSPYTDKLGPIEDFELWLRAADKFEFGIVPESLYLYRLNTQGLSSLGSTEQHKRTKELIAKQWKKPFALKSYKDIIADGYFYKNINSTFANQVYDQYINQNIHLARGCLNNGWFRRGLLIALASRKLDAGSFRAVKIDILYCALNKLRLKKG